MNHPLRNLIRNKELMASLANTYGTPTYVYDYLRLKHNLNALDKSLSQHFNKYHICYAVKSNSNPHLLKNMLSIIPNLGIKSILPKIFIIKENFLP